MGVPLSNLRSKIAARRARAARVNATLAELDTILPGRLDSLEQQMRADIRRRTEQIPDDTLDRIWQAIMNHDAEEDGQA